MVETLKSPTRSGYDESLSAYSYKFDKKPKQKAEVVAVLAELQADQQLEAAARLALFNARVSRGSNPLLKQEERDILRSQSPEPNYVSNEAGSSAIASADTARERARKDAVRKMAAAMARNNGVTMKDLHAADERMFLENVDRTDEYKKLMAATEVLSKYDDAAPHPASYDYQTAAEQFELPMSSPSPDRGFEQWQSQQEQAQRDVIWNRTGTLAIGGAQIIGPPII